MNDETIHGVWTAIATPFQTDGSIDWVAFEKILELQISGAIDGVVISGTTGEAPTLTVQEKISLVRKARAILPKSTRVMAGSGGNNTSQSIELSKLCLSAGADSLLIVTPPYNKPSMNGLKLHFTSIAEQCQAPICLYHVPGRTGQSLSASNLAILCSIKGVQSVKEASGDLALFGRLTSLTSNSILSGDDPTFLSSLAVGGKGVISVVSNIFPKAMTELMRSFQLNDLTRALLIHQILLPAIDILFCESNPGPLKAALNIRGLAHNILRAPLSHVSPENFAIIEQTLDDTDKKLKNEIKM